MFYTPPESVPLENPKQNAETQASAAKIAEEVKAAQIRSEEALSWIDQSANLFPDKSSTELKNVFLAEHGSDALRQTLLDEIIARVERGEEEAMGLAGELANRKQGEFYWPNQARRIAREVLTKMIDQQQNPDLRQKALEALYPHTFEQEQEMRARKALKQKN